MILFVFLIEIFKKKLLGLVEQTQFIDLWIEKIQDFHFLIIFYYDFFFSFNIWGEAPPLVDPQSMRTFHASGNGYQ